MKTPPVQLDHLHVFGLESGSTQTERGGVPATPFSVSPQGECLRHPRVQQSQGREPPALVKPKQKRPEKEIHQKELCEYYEHLIERDVQAGWEVIFPNGSSENYPVAGQVGGYGVLLGDHRDVAEFIPVIWRQSNSRGELRAAVRALQGKTIEKQTSSARTHCWLSTGLKWKRHGWVGSNGLVSHVDLWEWILELLSKCGHEVHWLQGPSHIGICGSHKADELADVGRRKSPCLGTFQ